MRKAAVVPDAVDVAMPVFAARAEGAWIWDVDGNGYIDLAGGVGCLNVGHSHPRVIEAIRAQVAQFTHTDFSVVPYEGYVAVAERLARIAPGPSPKQVALFNSGAEAVENAVKVARVATGRPAVIAFEGAFHGRTYMALSLTSRIDPFKRGMGPFVPEVYRAPYPDPYRSPDPHPTRFVMRALERMFVSHVDAQQVAAIVVEPILGEGGFVVPPADFLPALRTLCDQHGILLIADEIQTGLGRTGRMWATEHTHVEPDLLITAKSLAAGLPLSAVVGRQDVFERVPPRAIGGTYVGNPVACAAALAVLDVIDDERLIERAQRIGAEIRQRFTEYAARHAIVGDVRGLGAMMAIELVKNRHTKEPAREAARAAISHALAEGVLILGAGTHGNVIRVLVPLVISHGDLDQALGVIDRALAAATR